MTHPMLEIIKKRQNGVSSGIVSFCTANKIVIETILEYYLEYNNYVLIECTANQVNQFGGYTNMTPKDFMEYVFDIADNVGFPKNRIILGADHFGPLPWSDKPEKEAMKNAKELLKQTILSGYTKIHLDTSMFLGDDEKSNRLSDETIAERGAILYQTCEKSFKERLNDYPDSIHPVYVIGSEVPTPGGEFEEQNTLEITKPDAFENMVKTYSKKFKKYGLNDAWQYIIAVVVQPGVEFNNMDIHDYDRKKSTKLCKKLTEYPNLVFEGHSTDFQFPNKLKEMVEDGVAILKVGPALTFALREGLFSLSLMEKELIKNENQRSNFMELLEKTMLKNPKYWEKYYLGLEFEKEISRKYSFSDRSRYYLSQKDINESIEQLFKNIDSFNLPLGLIKQFFPEAYLKIRLNKISGTSSSLVKSKIINVIEDYHSAIKEK